MTPQDNIWALLAAIDANEAAGQPVDYVPQPPKDSDLPYLKWKDVTFSPEDQRDAVNDGYDLATRGNTGVLTLDFDNPDKGTDSKYIKIVIQKYCDRLKARRYGLLNKTVWEDTPTGGAHCRVRVTLADMRAALAALPANGHIAKVSRNGKDKAIIEVKGEGKLCRVAPSPGYKEQPAQDYTLFNQPFLDPGDLDILLEEALEFNEVPITPKPQINLTQANTVALGDRVGDLFNQHCQHMAPGYIQEAGFTIVNNTGKGFGFTNPGSDSTEHHGTYNRLGEGKIMFYSPNVPEEFEFELEKPYTLFQFVAKTIYKGDFSACTKELAQISVISTHLQLANNTKTAPRVSKEGVEYQKERIASQYDENNEAKKTEGDSNQETTTPQGKSKTVQKEKPQAPQGAIQTDPDPQATLRALGALWPSHTLKEGLALPPPDYLVYGAIEKGAIGWLFGRSGAGKTYLGLDLAVSIAAGLPWLGQYDIKVLRDSDPAPRKVLYFAAEGQRMLFRRIVAAVTGMGLRQRDKLANEILDLVDTNLTVVSKVPQLFDDRHPRAAIKYVEYWQALGQPQVDMIFVDTLQRAAIGSEENHSKDANIIINTIEALQDEMGQPAVAVIHHTNKKDGDFRGSTSYEDNMTFGFKVTGRHKEQRTLLIDKLKDGEIDGPQEGQKFLADFERDPVTEGTYVIWTDNEKPKETPQDKAKAKARIKVLAYLRTIGKPASKNQISENTKEENVLGPKAIFTAIEDLEKEGEIIYTPGPRTAILCSIPVAKQLTLSG